MSTNTNERGLGLVGVLVTVAVLAAAGTTAWLLLRDGGSSGSSNSGASGGGSDAPVLAVAEKQSFEITTTAVGELEAGKQIELRSRLEQTTTIMSIIKEGTQVKAGEVLVTLNSDNLQTQIDEEKPRLATATADLAMSESELKIQGLQNEATERDARLKLALAELELEQWRKGEVVSKRQANDLAFDRATRERERLGEKYQRSVGLAEQGFLSRDELKRDELAKLEADAAFETARLAREVYEGFEYPKEEKTKESAVKQAEAELAKVLEQNKSLLVSRTADVNNKREQKILRESKLAKLEDQKKAATITAPSDGLVVYATSLNRERGWGGNAQAVLDVGTDVKANQPIIVLPDTSQLNAAVRVHESLVQRIRPGVQAAQVRIDALGGQLIPGTVTALGLFAETGGWRDPNLREITIKIALDLSALDAEQRNRIKPSMRAEATIVLDRVNDALAVPAQAVFTEAPVNYVLVPAGRRFDRRPVLIGRRSNRLVEVLAGLNEGDQVLLREPAPGEQSEKRWDAKELAAVGLRLLDDGKVEPIARRGPPPGMGIGGPGPGAPGAGGPPAGAGTGGAGRGRPGGAPGASGGSGGPPAGAATPR